MGGTADDKIKAAVVEPKLSFSLKGRFLIAAHNILVNTVTRSDGTVNRSLFNLFEPKASAPYTKQFSPSVSVSCSDVTVDSSRNLWFRLYVPNVATTTDDDLQPAKLPLIFYIHGGGFAFFGPDTKPFDHFCRHLAGELSSVVVSVNYRLAPEHRFPSQYDDCFDTLKFLDCDADLQSKVDLGKCFMVGDSAGGNIAHHVTLRVCQHREEFERLRIIGLIALQPFFGGEERTESELRLTGTGTLSLERTDWMWKSFLPEGANRDHEAANVFGGGPNDRAEESVGKVEFPATIVVVGGFDQLKDWHKRYYEGLKRCGKEVEFMEYPNAIHGFYGFPELPEFSLVLNDMRGFVLKRLALPSSLSPASSSSTTASASG